MRIYLAGPIFGCSDEEATGWREEAKRMLPGHELVDPMVRDYRGREDIHVAQIVREDLDEISNSDVVVADCRRPSWGTAMEIQYAAWQRIPVVAVAPPPVSPWLQAHAEIVDDLDAVSERLR